MKDTISNNLKLLRGKKTQTKWAKELGVNKMTVSAWERGLRWPKQSRMERIAKKKKLKVGDLFREDLFIDGMIFHEPEAEYFANPEVMNITRLIRKWKEEEPDTDIDQFLKQLYALPEEKREIVFQMVKALS